MSAVPANPFALPVHPTRTHPHTGDPLHALWVRPDGRVMWPILGASPDDGAGGGDGGQGGDGGGAGGGADGGGSGAGGAGDGGGNGNAVDDKGRDLGYPANTPVAEMTDAQRANYWEHKSRKHEGRYKSLVGDRGFDAIKSDLDAYAQIQKDQQTPAEQALTAARDEGKAEARREERTKAATAVFRGALEAGGIVGNDLDDLVENFNVAGFITDDGVDTTKITNFAKRFASGPGTGRNRDFGGGNRGGGNGNGQRGSKGKAEAQKRFGKKTNSGE